MKNVKKAKDKDKDKTREYAFETKKGEIFSLIFHPALDQDPNPPSIMRLEIQDETEQQEDPGYDPAEPKLVMKMKDINLWTPDEIMLFVREHLMMPGQEHYNQFFGPVPNIEIVIENEAGPPAVGAEREFKASIILASDLISEFRKDFFTD
jgi:hypothetical protein